jgi:hypothetical protein
MTVAIPRILPSYSRIGVVSVHELVRFRVSLPNRGLARVRGRGMEQHDSRPAKTGSGALRGMGEAQKERRREWEGQILVFPAGLLGERWTERSCIIL